MRSFKKWVAVLAAVCCCCLAACNKGTTPTGQPKPTYTVTVAAVEHGTIAVDKTTVEEGGNVVVAVTPDEGYVVDKLTVNGKTAAVTGTRATVCDVKENLTVGATFTVTTGTVSFSTAVEGESFEPIGVVLGQPYGELPIGVADGNKVFTGWTYDRQKVTATSVVSVKGDHVLKAVYEELPADAVTLRTPYSLTVAYYDALALSLGVSYHSKAEPYMPVLQLSEGDAFDAATAKSYACTTRYWETEYVNQTVVDDLAFGTTYTYRVGDRITGAWSDEYTLTTRANDAASSFIYLADTQQSLTNAGTGIDITDAGLLLQEATAAHAVDFIVHGGDLVDKGDNPDFWKEMLGDMESVLGRLPFVFVQGNHECNDYYCQNVPDLFDAMFKVSYPAQNGGNNGVYYSMNIGAMHFVVLRSNDAYVNNGYITQAQLDWLAADLATANADTDTVWNVVALHEPVFAARTQNASSNVHTLKMRAQLMPILRAGKVDLVLQAHTHINYVSYPLEYTSDTSVVDSDGNPQWATVAVNAAQKTTVESATGETLVTYTDYRSGVDGTVFHEVGTAGRQYSSTYKLADKAANLAKYPLIENLYSGAYVFEGVNKPYGFYDCVEVTATTLTVRNYAFNYNDYLTDKIPAVFLHGFRLAK